MQAVFVEGSRPKTKKALKEAVANGDRVELEATSAFGNEWSGPVTMMPENKAVPIVGPAPLNRKWYATIKRVGDKVTVS